MNTSDICYECQGSGECQMCFGLGVDDEDQDLPCGACFGSGECPECSGTGEIG